MSVSLWQRLSAREARSCEVAVIGAGIAGLSAAIELESMGVSAVVLESRAIGAGASGRNAGFLMRGAAENYAQAIDAWGRERARTLWRWTEQNLEDLRALGAGELGSFSATPSCLLGADAEEEAQLRRSAELLREDGFDVRVVESGDIDDAVWARGGASVGLVNPNDAVVSPVELVGMLASKLESTEVDCGVEVASIRAAPGGVTLETSGGEVRAGRVLVCTNAWAGALLPELAGVVEPNRGQMLALRPNVAADASLACAYYLDHGSEYIRPGPDGTVVFGGARKYHAEAERCASEQSTPEVQARLESMAATLFPGGFGVVARWAGVMGFSPDGLPLVGPVGDDRVWACVGFTGHGMSLGHRTARHAARAMMEGTAPEFDLRGRFARG
ncbi:MAG: FAD-binding oxidoreductase [Phycisphaerales bacterium]